MPTEQDGTKTQPDATLTAEKTQTPTFTQEQVDKAVRDARSAVLADAGRSKTAAEKALSRLSELEKRIADEELEAARDEPDKLTALRERQQRRQAESELAQVRQELSERDELVKQHETEKAEAMRERNTLDIATRMNVDPVRLAKLAKFTDGTAEAIEDIAKELPRKDGKPPLKLDSSGTIGGGLSREQIIAAYTKDPRNLAVRERYLELRRQEGR